MRQQRMVKAALAVLVLLAAAAAVAGCNGAATPGGKLEYNGPTEQSVPMGGTLPGTDIRYIGYSERGAEVVIADQRTLRKIGDSLDWKGSPVGGVEVSLAQRVLMADPERLQTAGTVKVTVSAPAPEAAPYPDKPKYSYKVAVTYTVKRGATIPGTQITYLGKRDDGAEMGGVSGYPYRKLADSISWSGRLRPNAYLDMTVRVVAYTDDFLQLAGLATIGLVGE